MADAAQDSLLAACNGGTPSEDLVLFSSMTQPGDWVGCSMFSGEGAFLKKDAPLLWDWIKASVSDSRDSSAGINVGRRLLQSSGHYTQVWCTSVSMTVYTILLSSRYKMSMGTL